MRIILLGPPGSGKGTQGDLIQHTYALPKISSGDLLREAISNGTELGKKAESFYNRGELVSDDIVLAMIAERIRLDDCKPGFILDGFPRNIPQAQKLVDIDPENPEIALDIRLPDKIIVERLSARRICSQCSQIYNLAQKPPEQEATCDKCGGELIQRKDDTADVILRRLQVYQKQTLPLVEYYQNRNVYFFVDGEGTAQEVFQRITSLLDSRISQLRVQI